MEIIVLGTGCAKCKTTYDRIAKFLEDNTISADLKKEENILEIVKYNVLSLPAVVVNGEIKLKGAVPSDEEIRNALTAAV